MKSLLSSNNEIVFVNDSKELTGVKGLSNKRLCIIKTNFSDINKIKKLCKSHPKMEVWLACEDIRRENIITANMCGIKNVIQYPINNDVVKDLLNNSDLTAIRKNDFENDITNLKNLKVMIVDDNIFNTQLLEETLKPLDLNLKIYNKPLVAAKIIEEEKFDLFLLDIMMPELSGYELAKIIKNSSENNNTPIIFISALSDNENKLKSFNSGSYIFIEKPFNIEILKSQICSLLKEQREKEECIKLHDSYMAMLTHDMKGPVQAEIAALKFLLNKDQFSEENREILYDMLSSSKYLQNLVTNVLYKYKSDYGTFEINKELNSLKVLISEACDEMQYIAIEKNSCIRVQYKSNIEKLFFDYNELKRVLHNILTNAIKHSYMNSDIFIDIENDNKNIIVSIKNSGEGIPQDLQQNVFDQFVSYCKHSKSVNLGLGLHICKQIIKAHNGTIKMESIPKEYTKITFTLPLKY